MTALRPSSGGSGFELCIRRTAHHRSSRYVNRVGVASIGSCPLKPQAMRSTPPLHRSTPTRVGSTLLTSLGLACGAHAQEDPTHKAGDAFGHRIGQESIGLYSESLVRGFNLQESGNYRLEDAYFVRAANPSDAVVEAVRVRVGSQALDLDFPAPSGLVDYRLIAGDRERSKLELGFQHLSDNNPRPYLRAHAARRSNDGNLSLAAGFIGSHSARYIFGNEAEYYGIGLVPRARLGERWQITGVLTRYEHQYQADVGFTPPARSRCPGPSGCVTSASRGRVTTPATAPTV
ncbi:hypothetical protein [Lysobacter gummosus]|uniref:hypothetical protein n=1 Tax=Lysobacter gummosus TaxID=262324 RepID=UPI00362A51FE